MIRVHVGAERSISSAMEDKMLEKNEDKVMEEHEVSGCKAEVAL